MSTTSGDREWWPGGGEAGTLRDRERPNIDDAAPECVIFVTRTSGAIAPSFYQGVH